MYTPSFPQTSSFLDGSFRRFEFDFDFVKIQPRLADRSSKFDVPLWTSHVSLFVLGIQFLSRYVIAQAVLSAQSVLRRESGWKRRNAEGTSTSRWNELREGKEFSRRTSDEQVGIKSVVVRESSFSHGELSSRVTENATAFRLLIIATGGLTIKVSRQDEAVNFRPLNFFWRRRPRHRRRCSNGAITMIYGAIIIRLAGRGTRILTSLMKEPAFTVVPFSTLFSRFEPKRPDLWRPPATRNFAESRRRRCRSREDKCEQEHTAFSDDSRGGIAATGPVELRPGSSYTGDTGVR